jgi:glycosyltransferase involved in cell wall biosynthesis
MKVIMFDAAYPPPILGGKEKQAHILASELKRRGAKISALSYRHNGKTMHFHDSIAVYRVKRNLFSPLLFFMRLTRLKKYFQILHVHTPSRIGHFIAFCGSILGYQVVFKFPNEKMLESLTSFERVMWRTTVRRSELLVILEAGTKMTLKEEWGIKDSKIFLASNGVVLSPQKQYKQMENQLNILFVGRLTEQKRCEDLIEACQALSGRNVNWGLDIVGDGPLMADLQTKVSKINDRKRVTFHSYQADTIKFMQAADLLLLPSTKEGMSNVVLEAMSIGLPVICTDVGSAKTMLGDYGAKYLIKPNDIEAMTKKIELFAKDFSLLNEYGLYLFNRCNSKYSIANVAASYSDRYCLLGN